MAYCEADHSKIDYLPTFIFGIALYAYVLIIVTNIASIRTGYIGYKIVQISDYGYVICYAKILVFITLVIVCSSDPFLHTS